LREAVGSAAEETERLIRLAEDLLTVARVESGQFPVRPGRIDVSELLARVAARQPVNVSVACPEGLGMVADELRVEQALTNLLDNARRHGRAPIGMRAESRPGGTVRVTISDRGPGLAPGFENSAFERFTRGDAAREGAGAGLGLAIVRAVAQSHGGSAGLSARDGGGLDAWVEIPPGGPPRGGD
jgi:signal transduction histidine kinase